MNSASAIPSEGFTTSPSALGSTAPLAQVKLGEFVSFRSIQPIAIGIRLAR